jgi:hypothetical protein
MNDTNAGAVALVVIGVIVWAVTIWWMVSVAGSLRRIAEAAEDWRIDREVERRMED